MSIMREQREAMEAANAPEARATALAEFDAIVGHIRRRENIPADVRSKPGAAMFAQMNDAGLAYMHDVDAADPAAAIAELPIPVLIVQGGRDESVRPHHADRLKSARGARPTELGVYAELQHFYKSVPEGITGMAAFGLQGETDRRVTADVDRWVRGL
jgi:pimeloyl-ACP methyl ester carboxylesterase